MTADGFHEEFFEAAAFAQAITQKTKQTESQVIYDVTELIMYLELLH